MARVLITCPFSNRMCMECGIYRGRHFYLCSVKGHRGDKWDIWRHSSIELQEILEKQEQTFFKRLSDSPGVGRIIYDVENLIEAEEFSRFKEKGEKHDT